MAHPCLALVHSGDRRHLFLRLLLMQIRQARRLVICVVCGTFPAPRWQEQNSRETETDSSCRLPFSLPEVCCLEVSVLCRLHRVCSCTCQQHQQPSLCRRAGCPGSSVPGVCAALQFRLRFNQVLFAHYIKIRIGFQQDRGGGRECT